jgi:hypothetical protein
MTEANQYRAYFTLVGDFDPSEITKKLGIEPTRAWKKGEVNPATNLDRKRSRWCLDSSEDPKTALEHHLCDVLYQLRNCFPQVAELRSKYDGCLQAVAYFYRDYPGFSLDESVISDLAKLKLGVDCDFYYLYSSLREDSD